MGHQAVIIDMGDHYVLIGGDASYCEEYMLNGDIDGVCVDGSLHHESTKKMRQLCRNKPTITQFAHDFDSEKTFDGQDFQRTYESRLR